MCLTLLRRLLRGGSRATGRGFLATVTTIVAITITIWSRVALVLNRKGADLRLLRLLNTLSTLVIIFGDNFNFFFFRVHIEDEIAILHF